MHFDVSGEKKPVTPFRSVSGRDADAKSITRIMIRIGGRAKQRRFGAQSHRKCLAAFETRRRAGV